MATYPLHAFAPGRRTLAVGFGIGAALLYSASGPGPRSAHMATHIIAMNVIAPLAAMGATRLLPRRRGADRALLAGFVLQIGLFYAWHLPVAATMGAMPHALMHAALPGAALLFWLAIFSLDPAERWRGFVALMLTGKLACLLGALLLFSPRLLDGAGVESEALDDQRMAGLLMLAACPLCYLASAIVIAAKWLRDIEAAATRRPGLAGSG